MEDIDFWVNFVVGNSNDLQKLGLEGKFSWALNVFTLGQHHKLKILSTKQGNFFCLFCHNENSQTTMFHVMLLESLESSRWVKGAPTWFEIF